MRYERSWPRLPRTHPHEFFGAEELGTWERAGLHLAIRLKRTVGVSLPTFRATRSIHTLVPRTTRIWPKLSAVSLSHRLWVKRSWLRPIGRNLPGLGSVGDRNSVRRSI